jgi:ABC-type iron transport system FetAB ATPase subunit
MRTSCSVEAGNSVMFSGSSLWGRYVQLKQVMALCLVELGNGVMFSGNS